MFLKKIQAVGFKSFAEKISIPFDRGITGIVGPNGSGKSNVIDAVRWVMGEQNAKNLRGKIATDIIFSGSASRKPMAMAEVTLIFDNSDEGAFCPPEYRHEPEISLTRRLYLDGEREYLINRKPCRLKDIVNFFATTGLGGRSYSMIQQGQVDRILNAKPEDVRIIIEEAAGTMVFKNRRDEALRKLTNTRENLARIEDIVAELERQQSSLKTQMEKARTWRDFSDRLHQEELSLFSHNFHFYNEQRKLFDADLKGLTDQEIEILAQNSTLDARQLELQAALDASDPGLEGLREAVSIVREQIARAESIILGTDAKVDGHKARLTDLEVEIAGDSENLQAFEEQLNLADTELSTAKEKARDLRELIESFQEQVDAVDEEAMVFKQRVEDFEDELKNIERLLENNAVRCEAINRERDKIAGDQTQWDERIESLDREITDLKRKVDLVQTKMSSAEGGLSGEVEEREDIETSLAEARLKIEGLLKDRDEHKEKYFGLKARIASLADLLAASSDAATVLQNLKQEYGNDLEPVNCGLISDHIRFNDQAADLPKFLRTAFEKWSERLTCETIEELYDLTRACQATGAASIPVSLRTNDNLAEMTRWSQSADVENFGKYIDVVSSGVKAERVRGILNRVFLTQTLRLSDSEVQAMPSGALLFTGQGLAVHAGGEVLLCGYSEQASGALSRKSDMETLSGELKVVEGQLAACQSDIDGLQAKEQTQKTRLREIEQKLQGQSREVHEVMSELQSAKQLVQHKQELKMQAVNQKTSGQEFEKKLVAELSDQGQSRLSLDEERQRVIRELEMIRDDSQSIEDKREEVFRLHEGRKLEFARHETRAQALQQGYDQARSQLERLQNALTRRYDEKAKIIQTIEDIRSQFQQSRDEMEILLKRREDLETELTAKREENHEVLENLRQVDHELKKQREAHAKLDKTISQKRVEMERLKLAIEGICVQAMEKYHLKIEEIEFTADPEFDEKRTTREVAKLRAKIEDLGAINMMAIEEYDALIKRLDFICAQREEVLSSINLLEDALEEIEETTKNRFIDTFTQVNAEFTNLFPILFPSGEGRLELSTPEDPLNSGVDILVRLPGKKTQRMTLLSGGEKALTAISLIFALLKTKPTPFCFLDEVDAPLDEANVGRYNKVLEALSDRFQFIVITHNRRTMEVLDTLFGVTMQEPGVSKVVGVDMKKDIPDHLKKAFKTPTPEDRVGASAT